MLHIRCANVLRIVAAPVSLLFLHLSFSVSLHVSYSLGSHYWNFKCAHTNSKPLCSQRVETTRLRLRCTVLLVLCSGGWQFMTNKMPTPDRRCCARLCATIHCGLPEPPQCMHERLRANAFLSRALNQFKIIFPCCCARDYGFRRRRVLLSAYTVVFWYKRVFGLWCGRFAYAHNISSAMLIL